MSEIKTDEKIALNNNISNDDSAADGNLKPKARAASKEKAEKAKDSVAEGKRLALQNALAQIEKQFGKGAVMKLGETEALNVESISTGSIGLDIALGVGGVPKGRIIEIFGPEASGKTTVALQIVAQAQKNGGEAAFIDVEHAIDPVYARALGVDVDRLLISQPDSGEEALEIIEQLVRSGALDVIVLDSVAAMTTKSEIEGEMGDTHVGQQARLMSQAMRKLTSVVSKNNCAAIFINQIREKIGVSFGNPETTPGGRALKFYASVRIDVRKGDAIKIGGEQIGSRTKCKVVKNKVAPPFKETEYDIIFGEGISVYGELVDLACDLEIINKSGAWFSYNDEKLGQGRDNAKEFLKENPDIANEIKEKILENKERLVLISKKAKKGVAAAKTVAKASARSVNIDAKINDEDFK